MTELVVKLPDELVQRARSAGLLTDAAIQRLLEEAMRREAGRKLLAIAGRVHAAGIVPMSDEEIGAEVKAARAERRAAKLQKPQSGTRGSSSTQMSSSRPCSGAASPTSCCRPRPMGTSSCSPRRHCWLSSATCSRVSIWPRAWQSSGPRSSRLSGSTANSRSACHLSSRHARRRAMPMTIM